MKSTCSETFCVSRYGSRRNRRRSVVVGMAAASGLLHSTQSLMATTYSFTTFSGVTDATNVANYTPNLPAAGPTSSDTLSYGGTIGGTLSLNGVAWTTGSVVFSDSVSGALQNQSTTANTTLTLAGPSTSPLISVTSADRFALLGTATGTGMTLAINLATSGTLNVAAGGTLGLGANIVDTSGGSARITKTGAGTLDLAYNSFTSNGAGGGLTISGGDVLFFNKSALGGGATGPAAFVSNFVTLDGGTLTYSSSVSSTAGFANDGVSITANNGTIEVSNSTTGYTENATVSGAGSLSKVGAGTLVLATSNTFLGGSTLSAGTVSIMKSGSLGTGTVNLAGGVLDFGTNGLFFGSSRAVNLTANSGVNVNTGTANIEGSVSGTGTITKTGAGTLIFGTIQNLGGTGTVFNGGVTINAGTVLFSASGDLGASTNVITLNGGTLSYTGYAGTTSNFNGTLLSSTRSLVLAAPIGDVNVGSDTFSSVTSPSTLTVNSTISGTGMLMKTGVGTLVLAGNSSYSGGTTINAGTVNVNAGAPLGSSTALNPIALTGGALNFSASLLTAPLNSNRQIYIGTAAAGTGTISVNNSFTARIGGPISDSTLGGVGALVVGPYIGSNSLIGGGTLNSGTLVLEGTSTFTGGTTIVGGSVILNSTSTTPLGTGAVQVGDGTTVNTGTLGGSGTTTTDVTVANNGTLAPGAFTTTSYTPGTLTIASHNLTLHTGSGFVAKIASSSSYDSIALTGGTGSVNFDSGTSTVDLSLVSLGSTAVAGDRYNLITFPLGTVVTNFTATTPSQPGTFVIDASSASAFNTSNASINYDPSFGDIYITGVVALPEPTATAIVVFTAIPLLRRRRRARRFSN